MATIVVVYYNMMITVPEAARRTGRNPETVRRWIREGKLPARRVGTQHFIDEDALMDPGAAEVVPAGGEERTVTGEAMPNFVTALRRSRGSR
ncbi:MAG: helix-turn-helix domain-containing protein [Acidobacteria bacterium]|nr:helix-turn-helix domain-containing protein [Acidobacteriota bacterium]